CCQPCDSAAAQILRVAAIVPFGNAPPAGIRREPWPERSPGAVPRPAGHVDYVCDKDRHCGVGSFIAAIDGSSTQGVWSNTSRPQLSTTGWYTQEQAQRRSTFASRLPGA